MNTMAASVTRQFRGSDGERAMLQYDHYERSEFYPHQVRYVPPGDDMPLVVHRGAKLEAARRVWSRIERELIAAGLTSVE